jgi:hypothetical protein
MLHGEGYLFRLTTLLFLRTSLFGATTSPVTGSVTVSSASGSDISQGNFCQCEHVALGHFKKLFPLLSVTSIRKLLAHFGQSIY